jgi:hypothetical protein
MNRILQLVLIIVPPLFIGCANGSSGCGGPNFIAPIFDRNLVVYFSSVPTLFNNDTLSVFLLNQDLTVGPQKGSYDYLPLPLNLKKVNYLVKKIGGESDTITVEYDIKAFFDPGDICDDPKYYPRAVVSNCYSRNLLISISSFRSP